ncbi:MAG: CotH kinase family protein, partial [Spirochaetia bacterium]|nr:CotH kinase family protein [Spirochaetia bacterium]
MKLTLRKILTVLPVALLAILFTGVMISCSNDSGSDNGLALLLGGNKQTSPNKEKPAEEVTEPVFNTRTEALDFIFGTDKLASTKITITRRQWNKLLEYYAINPSNEECVHAEYRFEKDGKVWTMNDVGFRIRGNTSRTRPQDEESKKYVQAHFKVDFEEWPVIVDGVETDPDRKLENCMKGVILKRFKDDFTYSREIFGYNYFRDCGVWTAPRAGYTRLLLDIVEEDGSIEKVDYGVYAMIENIDKQFLKERTSEEKGGDFNGNKGNLWKCTWKNGSGPNFKNDYEDNYFGVEDIKLDPNETSYSYNYDLKTNKDKLSKAITEIKGWIDELNSLNDSDSSAIKAWYEEKMDVDLFLKTYAVNVILGMWDDYWINNNNYYFYFDK